MQISLRYSLKTEYSLLYSIYSLPYTLFIHTYSSCLQDKLSAYQQHLAEHISVLTPMPCLPLTLGGASRIIHTRISHPAGGFTLRCLQRLSLPDSASLLWDWLPTGAPAVRPSRSSRTEDGSAPISPARAG